MGIVIITIPGEAQRAFANSLHRLTRENVDLVVIQKQRPNHNSLFSRLKRLYRAVGFWALPTQIWYAVLLRLDQAAKKTLEYFRARTTPVSESDYLAKTLEVISANDDEVLRVLQKLSPNLIVIWGSTIIKPRIIRTAKRAINLHMGLCPYYRGAIANQHAVINGHLTRIGATIHYAEEKVDAGDILATITVDVRKPPQELFRELNDRAVERYLEIAHRLFVGEELARIPQDISQGENLLLAHWTPKTRYRLARQIVDWERNGALI